MSDDSAAVYAAERDEARGIREERDPVAEGFDPADWDIPSDASPYYRSWRERWER